MAQDYDNNNRGSIWKNDKKTTDKHPDFTGSLNVNGVDFWVSAWKRKEDANDKAPALSFSIKPKDEAQGEVRKDAAPSATGGSFDDIDDDIPF